MLRKDQREAIPHDSNLQGCVGRRALTVRESEKAGKGRVNRGVAVVGEGPECNLCVAKTSCRWKST